MKEQLADWWEGYWEGKKSGFNEGERKAFARIEALGIGSTIYIDPVEIEITKPKEKGIGDRFYSAPTLKEALEKAEEEG